MLDVLKAFDGLSLKSKYALNFKLNTWLRARTLLIACLSFGFLSSSFNSLAIEVEGLYQVELQVTDQTPSNRWRAALTGLKEVLVRKSGSRAILDSHEVQQAYAKVTRYIQRFEYSKNDLADSITSSKANSNDSSNKLAYTLAISFEPRLVDELIQSAGMPIWGSNRPLTILWLAVEQDFKRQIIKEQVLERDDYDQANGFDSDQVNTDDPQALLQQSFVEQIKDNAIRRGIPILLPLMDLEDQINIRLSDVWGRFNQPVELASKRYGADTLISGRVSQSGDYWQAKLTYINNQEQQSLQISSLSIEQLVADLTDKLAEVLCQKYCVVEMAQPHQLSLQVSNVASYAQFKHLQKYLESLSSIRKVGIDKVSTTNLLLSISLLGDIESVKEALRLGNRLLVDIAPDTALFNQPIKTTADSFDALSDDISTSRLPVQDQSTADNIEQTDFLETTNNHQTEENNEVLQTPEQSGDSANKEKASAGSTQLNNSGLDGQITPPSLEHETSQVLYYRWTQ